MKLDEIAQQNGFNPREFETYLENVGADIKKVTRFGFVTLSLETDIEKHVQAYKTILAEQQKKKEEEEKAKRLAEEKKQKAVSSMLITSGFHFEGYKITKYSGYISGDDAISIPRGTDGIFSSAANVSAKLTESLVEIRRHAIQELKEAAYDLGCNAVIGVDFDYITLSPETANSAGGTTYLPYVFCVTANGNAVIIEEDK